MKSDKAIEKTEVNHSEPKKRGLRRGFWALAVILLIGGAVYGASDYQKREKAQKAYESLADMAWIGETEAEEAPSGEIRTAQKPYECPVDFDALRKINPEVVGWLAVPDTKINYPIVQAGDNDKYLDTDFEGKKSVAGSVYLDFESSPGFSGKHTIIYGHNMRNGCMFRDIVKYKELEFFEAHPDLYIYTPEKKIHLKAMAAVYTDAGGIRRKTRFQSEKSFDDYVDVMTKGCPFRVMPEEKIDMLYSFVTCSYEFNNARTILYAYPVP